MKPKSTLRIFKKRTVVEVKKNKNSPSLKQGISIFLIILFFSINTNLYARVGDDQAPTAKTVQELMSNYGTSKTSWDASTGTLYFTASGSINFNYGYPLEYKFWLWNVPSIVKVIHVNSGVTVNGGFYTTAAITIEGSGRGVSTIFGTTQKKWADDVLQNGTINLDEWNYSTIMANNGADCVIRDLKFLNPYSFHVSANWTEKLTVSRCDFIDDRGGAENHSDGIMGGPGTVVDNCYFSTADDNIKFVQNSMTVKNCTFNMIVNSIPFQYGYNFGYAGNYSVENCIVTGTSGSSGAGNMPIFSYRGPNSSEIKTTTVTGCRFENPNASIFEMGQSGVNSNFLNININSSLINVGRFAGVYNSNITYTICGGTNQTNYYDCTTADTQAPSVVGGLASSAITQTSFTLSWTASTDNVGVTGYEIFKNGTWYAETNGTNLSITGLTANTAYTMTIKAFDAAGNYSNASTGLSVTTASANLVNILTNPGFESALTSGWTYDWSNAVRNTTSKRSGSYGLQVGSGAGGRAQPITAGFTVGSQYTLSAWCKLSGAGSGGTIGVICKNGAGTQLGSYPSSAVTNTGSFAKKTVTFTVPSGTTVMEVYAYYNGGGTRKLYADDFGLTAGSTALARVANSTEDIADEKVITPFATIYPNPVSGNIININTTGMKGEKSIAVFDITGKLVYTQKLSGSAIQTIKLNSAVTRGTYTVKIITASGNFNKLLMVQ